MKVSCLGVLYKMSYDIASSDIGNMIVDELKVSTPPAAPTWEDLKLVTDED